MRAVTCRRDGQSDRLLVVTIDLGHVPAGSQEPRGLIHGGGKFGPAVDGDAIVVEEQNQLAELQMAGEIDGLVADAFHQAAVASQDIGVVID